jgi:hypothetical protein
MKNVNTLQPVSPQPEFSAIHDFQRSQQPVSPGGEILLPCLRIFRELLL